ncbi:zf-HC2 domain-containing protein [Paenibacillus sedimenti]|uniref:Zf-HC2 domain-containing protein n=1 Tax=Paenibacillus sedimenti TaxID=2770274 RepID=A0A926KN88_9BACL|nr:zf-HC2 domain-containing protein [Paenibacillus sedimenti]MBD0380959.1 zf-HC2 domain-containing protein [Paenibacillus sedimenti]
MSKISCDIIKDLLPLYYDNVCSANTKESVEAHIATCEDCKSILDKLNVNIGLPQETIEKNKLEGNGLKSISAYWNRSKAAAFARGMILATTVCAAFYFGYIGLYQWNITKVPTDVIEITNVSRLKDGKIAYHIKMTDGYNVNQVNSKLDSDGGFYMTPVRPLIKSKKFADIGLANMYYSINLELVNANQKAVHGKEVEIQAVYYGSPEDRILIWKKGMELPAASDAIEAQFINRD